MRKLDNKHLLWVCVDFDGTICNSRPPKYKPEKPIRGAKNALERIEKLGYKVQIYTSRPWADYNLLEEWLLKYKMPFHRIICGGKPLAKWYIDDRNLEFRDNWQKIAEKLEYEHD